MDEKEKRQSANTWMTFNECDEPEEKSAKWYMGKLIGRPPPRGKTVEVKTIF
jgi:hypothetical protein